MPRHRQGAAAKEQTDAQGREFVALGGGVQREDGALPSGKAERPRQQRGKTGCHVHLRVTGGGFIRAVFEPVAQALAQGGEVSQCEESGDHAVLTAASGKDGSIDPQGEGGTLRGSQGKTFLQGLFEQV